MAAQDAELKLKVSLDLGFFRQQLAGLGQAAAGYSIPVQVKFDRRSVQNELNVLSANIRKRNYTLNVNTNLATEIDNAKKLAEALGNLSKARSAAQAGIRQQMGMGALLPGPKSGGIGSKEVGKLYRAAAKAGLLEFDKEVARQKETMIAALDSVGRDAIAGLLNGLSSQNEQLRNAASSIGETLIKTTKDILGIASPSREFKKIGQNIGEGLQQGMMSSMDKAFDAVEGLMRARMKVLDTIARGMFHMAGIDPAAVRAEAAQRRALPGVNFPATVPRQDIPIGPSSTGRALPPSATPGVLPGTAFASQRYLPTALSDDLKKILRGAAFAFVDAIRQEVRTVRIGLGASMQAALPAARVAGLLPGAVGREPNRYAISETREEMLARRTAEAYARSALRGEAVMGRGGPLAVIPRTMTVGQPQFMRAPSIPSPMGGGGGAVPPGGGGGGAGGGGFMGGMGGFGRAIGGINLPGAGTIREIGDEFGFAAKQVLLFGTAYKALAFLQSFPGQVGAAVGQLQTFRNTLGAISPTAQEAAASNQLILDLVEKYNVPLQSARDGFTKLYASMAPAGFSGDEIRNLFTGITQAAATFGMSADKVDRVNYAFAQMASKGQVMSEELKGQLGDVLPGAMALFAEAAGFEGPKAIQDFSAALEDGAYKGQAMVTLLKNVGVIMKQEFGPGAEGAARTFQGVINRMQNSMTLLYESFEPVAVGFLNSVVVPLTSGIKQISDGFSAFFTGAAAQTSGGFAIAQELERLRPAFDGIGQNVSALIQQFGQFARIALEVSKVMLQIAGNPIVGYLAKLYAIALPINIALNVMRGLWAANALQLLIFNTRIATGTSTLSAFRGMMAATGATAQATAASIRTAGITLRTFFATTGVGLVIVGVSMLIEKFLSMNQALADTKAKALGAAQAIQSMSQTEARAAEQSAQSAYKTIGTIAGRAGSKMQGPGNDRIIEISERELKQLQGIGAFQTAKDPLTGRITARRSDILSLAPQAQRLQAQAAGQIRDRRFQEKQTQQQAVLAPIPPSEGDGKTKKGKELDKYIADATQALKIEKERQLVAIEDRMLRGAIGESEAKRQSLIVEKLYEEKTITEALRLAKLKVAEENLSAADKALKIADLQKQADLEKVAIQEKYGVELLKAELALQDPLKNAIADVNSKIDEQAMLQENLKGGLTDLTYDQKAYLDVLQLTKDLTDAEKESVKGLTDELQRKREEYYKNEEALKRQQALVEAQAGLANIGGGLRAGFTGSAAGVFERAMEQYDNPEYAKQLADTETAAMKLRSVFEGLQGAISGVSSAFANVLTEGVAGMIAGTATAKEVFASFLQSVAQALSQAASQMIATYIAIGIAKMFAGMGGGSNADMSKAGINEGTLAPMRQYSMEGPLTGMTGIANGGFLSGGFKAFANGGMVAGPTLGLIGEGGEPEFVIPSSKMEGAMKRYNNGARGAGVIPSGRDSASPMDPGGMMAMGPIDVRYTVERINSVDYVTADQFQAGMSRAAQQGALQGEQRTLRKLRNSQTVRSRMGI